MMVTIDIAVYPTDGYAYHRRTTLLGEVPQELDCGAVGHPGPVLRFERDRHGVLTVSPSPHDDTRPAVIYGQGRSPLLDVEVPGLGTISVMERGGCP